jgi:hypothetical protein
MRNLLFIPCITYLLACGSQVTGTKKQVEPSETAGKDPAGKNTAEKELPSDTNYVWTKLTDNAAFQKSYNFQMFAIRDTLWVMHHDGGWFSLNGKDWTRSSLSNIIKNNGFLDYVWFKGALYGLGNFAGNIERFTLETSIYKTTDMRNWQLVSARSDLPRRFFYHPFVFDNKIWIIGGSDGNNMFSDIWNSEDGVHWTKQADELPFGKRQESQFVFFKNRIVLLNNDAWASEDAIHWTRLAERFVPEEIFGYAPVVYDNKIWLLGCNRNNIFKSEALVSEDGKNWTAEKAPWSPRGGATSCVYKDKVFMTGGKYGGLVGQQTNFIYSNDVWKLEKKQ